MNWIFTTLQWYIPIFILGIVFFPFSKKLFGRYFPDYGYAFSKALALLFLTYSAFLLGLLKILPFSQLSIVVLILGAVVINIYISSKDKQRITDYTPQSFYLMLIEEAFFIGALLFWAYIRGQEPSIRGLEKFMDYGFISSLLRSTHFPPLDMWLSADSAKPGGYFINYYYFGHLSGALLIKLSNIKATIGYNLILATVFALCAIQSFSLTIGIISRVVARLKNKLTGISLKKLTFFGLVGSFIVTLGGNLHTIYTFTTGYPNDNPIPFWKILSTYNPTKYWYPNATRFIPFTIHEFPSYSWVVADMHGHVFDIPFVLLTLAALFVYFVTVRSQHTQKISSLPLIVFLGFLTAVHYMTNAFDGPIYILLSLLIFFVLWGFTRQFLISSGVLVISFILFSLPFSLNFAPFVSGIGVNCSPEFLVNFKKIGPFIFEKGNCQVSPLWMLLLLWGFFWINFILFVVVKYILDKKNNATTQVVDHFVLLLFSFGTLLLIIPEFFYIKDIYPAHFRANTMFKLGYQAFIMMGIAVAYTFYRIKSLSKFHSRLLTIVFIFFFFFVAIYPLYSIPSYYGNLNRKVELDGAQWLEKTYPQDKEIIDYINTYIKGQPVILEAQGDSYTDFNRISAYTGTPTIAGWWVHEWLWRGSSDVVGQRIPDIVTIYESPDIEATKVLLNNYHVRYIVVSDMEKDKYPNLNEKKISQIAKKVFATKNGSAALYQVNP